MSTDETNPPPASKASAPKTEAKSRKTQPQNPPKRGISAPAASFLSLLTVLALGSAVFAFRPWTAPVIKEFLDIPAPVEIQTPPPGFVPIPTEREGLSLQTEAESLAPLKQQLQSLEQQLAELKAEREETTPLRSNDLSNELTARLQLADTERASYQAQVATLETQLLQLQQSLQKLANRPQSQIDTQAIQGMIVFQNLQAKALAGDAFQIELQRFLALSPAPADISEVVVKLEEMAPIGRPTLPFLQKEFAKATQAHLKQGDSGASLWGKLGQNVKNFVQLRRVDGEGDIDEQAIAAAEQALAKGEVKQAYEALVTLAPKQREAYGLWLTHARSYYRLPEWLDKLRLTLSESLENQANS